MPDSKAGVTVGAESAALVTLRFPLLLLGLQSCVSRTHSSPRESPGSLVVLFGTLLSCTNDPRPPHGITRMRTSEDKFENTEGRFGK